MRTMKNVLAAVLCAAMTVSLFAGLSLHAAAASTYNRTELEKVIADTAIAYYLKGPDCQYDSFLISGLGGTRTALNRQTVCRSPEEASPQMRYYTVCSSFPIDVYYDVILQTKTSRDKDSAEMLDVIRASRVFDFGYYNSSLGDAVCSLGVTLYNTYGNANSISSYYAKASKKAETNLAKLVEKFETLGDQQ